MSKCDYDVIFYRVFCLSLLVIAFIFTVILTNVFVDIDGLLAKKEKAKSNHVNVPNEEPTVTLLREPKPEIIFNEEKNYEDTEDGYRKENVYINEEEMYRNKRSLEARNFIFHLQNPNVKHILTNHLNALLEQMDAEELKNNDIDDFRRNNNKKEDTNSNEELKVNKDSEGNKEIKTSNNAANSNNEEKSKINKATVEINNVDNKSKIEKKSQNEMLHLAMHDILLQGIIGHMDLSEVYKKFNMLKKNFEASNNINAEETTKNGEPNIVKEDHAKNIEGKFFEELIKCKDLQHQILDTKANKDIPQKAVEDKKPEVIVKTLIDISSIDGKPQLIGQLNGKEIKGVIKMIYNGKPVKVRLSSSEETNSVKAAPDKIPKTTIEPPHIRNASTDEYSKDEDNSPVKLNIPQSYLNKAIANYFKNYSKTKRSINDKRYKRHIKIHYDPLNKTKSDDDELYVEIETHFDSKGLKGEKRKKMIRTLIEKIEKAIHSNGGAQSNKTKKHYHAHVKKRIQNPLFYDNPDTLVVKKGIPAGKGKVEHRHLDPIGKPEPISKAVDGNNNDVPNIYDKSGEGWKKQYAGPGFLTGAKALNSAEMSEVDVDYNRVMTFNGIPQRLQKPLNTDNSDEALAANYYDLGNLKFFVKDMDGSGISVGFNQYTDEEPDPETIKIFTGVDNLVKVYNHNYGQPGPLDDNNIQNQNAMDFENNGDIHGEHTILRRSAVEEDYHSNEYKMVFDSNLLPYDNYQDIFKRQDKNGRYSIKQINVTQNASDQPITMDLFDKKLKPSEIFSLANLLEEYRKKRSITVQKYSNIKTRRKLNKYLQSKPSKVFINKKRMKRHIDKIRIIATDKGRHQRKQSDENIFVVSNEDELSNRAVLSEVLRPNEDSISERIMSNDKIAEKVEEVYNYNQNPPVNYNQMYDDALPADNYITHVFDGRSRHNPLMSKYPHVFMEEISKSKEGDIEPAVYGNIRNVMASINNRYNLDQYDMPVPDFDETTPNYVIVSNNSKPLVGMGEPNTKTKYKLTVKIVPKNMTEMKSGFKEIHTSINKSYDKDGLRFYSLVNVSEISKIENIEALKNKTKKKEVNLTTTTPIPTVNPHLKAQQFKMKSMLKRHKQMIDLQLAHFKKEKEHLERILVANQSDSDEMLDIKLPGESRPLQMKKSDISKLLASVLRSEQQVQQQQQLQPQQQPNQWPSTVQTQPISTTRVITTTTKATTTYATTTPAPIPTPAPIKGTDKRLINIIEKNGKLTKEILNKIDKNTEMLETFLVKLIDRIERPPSPPVRVEYQEQTEPSKPKDIKMFPTHEDFMGKHTKNDSNYAIPFIYAYQHPYVNPDKPNTAVANVVYHGHIHTDNPQIPKEIMNANPRIVIPKIPQKAEQIKPETKGKFFIDSILPNGFKAMRPMGKSAIFPNQGMPLNATKVYVDNRNI